MSSLRHCMCYWRTLNEQDYSTCHPMCLAGW